MYEGKTTLMLGSSVVFGLGLLWFAYRRFNNYKKLGKRGVVESLHVYPVKSCAGIKLNQLEIEEVGPLLDRYDATKITHSLIKSSPFIADMNFVCDCFLSGHGCW
jgi:hypothetical protein